MRSLAHCWGAGCCNTTFACRLRHRGRFVCAMCGVQCVVVTGMKFSTVRMPVREGMTRVMRDKRFVTYVLTLAGYYMLAVQVMLMLPIMVNDVAGRALCR